VPDSYELLGEFYLRTGKDSEAEKTFQEALRLNARMPGSFYGLAKIYLRQGKYEQALASIDAALRLAPDSQSVHYLHGQILSKMGRKEEAKTEFATVDKMAAAGSAKDVETFSEGRLPSPEVSRQPPE
jgi:tetratricopeptide (TPR) repeat protein